LSKHRNNIAAWLWEDRAPVIADEKQETLRLVQVLFANIDRTIAQLEQFPETGQSRRERKRRIVITDSRYVMFYQISKDGKRISVTDIRGAQKPLK
jgi:plasmid stabilization system protein ParE